MTDQKPNASAFFAAALATALSPCASCAEAPYNLGLFEDASSATASDSGAPGEAADAQQSGPDQREPDTGSEPADAGATPGPDKPPPTPMPMPPMPMPVSCAAKDGCNAARYLGKIKGDNPSDPITTRGTSSEWLNVRVLEDSNASREVKVRLRLVGEGNANYDLFVYVAANADSVACDGSALASAQPDVAPEQVESRWDDNFASDDSRSLSVEVRHVSGDCTPWTLVVERP